MYVFLEKFLHQKMTSIDHGSQKYRATIINNSMIQSVAYIRKISYQTLVFMVLDVC